MLAYFQNNFSVPTKLSGSAIVLQVLATYSKFSKSFLKHKTLKIFKKPVKNFSKIS